MEHELSADADRFYEHYWKDGDVISEGTSSRQQQLVRGVFPEPPTGCRILEIGVGAEGGLIRLLAERNDVFGLDASPVAVASCAKLGIRAQAFNADRDAIPFEDDTFDVVLAFEVCEHLANPQFAIEEIRRVLKPGGRFVASTPNPLTHHWPRYFYPQLIEHDAFRDFLVVNKIAVEQELGLSTHWYDTLVPDPRDKAWSWVWLGRNAKQDAAVLVEGARGFWERVDAYGIRSRPLEAADLARAARRLAPDDVAACGLLAASQVYRLVNGEAEEFLSCVSWLVARGQARTAEADEAKYWLCLVEIELGKFNRSMLAEADFQRIFRDVSERWPERGEALTRELQAALALASKL